MHKNIYYSNVYMLLLPTLESTYVQPAAQKAVEVTDDAEFVSLDQGFTSYTVADEED